MHGSNRKVLILGAGCTGLSSAWRLTRNGIDVNILESAERPGGMSAGISINGNIYENGPHVFHSSDPEILDDIKGITKGELHPFDRTIKIKFLENLYDFPLSVTDVFSKLPPGMILSAIGSFLMHSVKGYIVKPKVENSETVLMRYYGKVLYELFFKSYIEHVWGIKASEFSPDFALQRIPKLDVLKVLDTVRSRLYRKTKEKIKTDKFVEKVEGELYTTKKGFSGITDNIVTEIERLGAVITLGATIKKINWDADRGVTSVLYSKNGEEFIEKAENVISTIPVNELIYMLDPVPEEHIIKYADTLRFRSLVFVGILVNRSKVLPASFMYFREHSFNRITDLSYFGMNIKPENGTILIAEISCGENDIYWKDNLKAKEAVLKDLEKEDLINADDILECHVYSQKWAYPMYTNGYEKSLKGVLDFIDKLGNLKSIGRQGGFSYINSHIAMRIGYDAADELIKGGT